jgi:hypothetical protein
MVNSEIDKAVENMCYDKAKIVHANSTEDKKHIKLSEAFEGYSEIMIRELHDYFTVWNADGKKCLTLLAKPDFGSEMSNVSVEGGIRDYKDVLRKLGYEVR